jgi:GntR family transcriptional regulator of arabinose operon
MKMNQEREPLYVQIQNHFKELIESRQLKEDDQIPTERELVETFKVSRITIANALAELVKEGWIYRIPGRGSFVKGIPEKYLQEEYSEPAASADSIEEDKRIGIIFPFIIDFFSIHLVQGIVDVLRDSGYLLQTMFSFNSKEREKKLIRAMKDQVEGLIIFPADAEVYNEEIIALKMSGYPLVLMDRHFPGVETNVVLSDNVMGGKLAVDHLWELGHRDIAIVSDSPLLTLSAEDRIQGYIDALTEKEALINPALIQSGYHIDKDEPLAPDHPLCRFVASRKATAYIALNSSLGVSIWSLVQGMGQRVPEDVSIVTFDNPTPMLGDLSQFTYIDQLEREIGIKAAELLMEILKNGAKARGRYQKIVMPPKLVARHSTGPVSK